MWFFWFFQAQVADISAVPVDCHPAPCPAVSGAGAEACSPRSASRMFAVTRSSAVVTSYAVTDTTSVISSPPMQSRVTLAELQPTRPAPLTVEMSNDLKTCFSSPSAAAVLTTDGSYRTTYRPMQISAQVLSLPRSITNCRNLSRPLTLCYAGRQVIVPPSCIVLSAEGAKLLLPPQTVVPNKPVPDALDLSCNSTFTTSTLFQDKTAELMPVSPSISRSASETTPSDQTDGLLALSADCKGEPSTEPYEDTTLSVGDKTECTGEAQYSAESVNQRVLLDEGQECLSDEWRQVDISKLSVRSLVHIFAFLHLSDLLRVRRVCSQWNTAARDLLLVSIVIFSGFFLQFNRIELLPEILSHETCY